MFERIIISIGENKSESVDLLHYQQKSKTEVKVLIFQMISKKKDKTEVKVMTFCIIRTTKVKNISSTFIFFLPFSKDLTDESHQLRINGLPNRWFFSLPLVSRGRFPKLNRWINFKQRRENS